MKKWNVAIIGLGFVGKLHYDALRRLPNVHVRTIVVHKAQDIPLVKENYDADVVTDCWQEAVADPQIQVIHNCTPNALHDEINLAAIGVGKHLYAEKPMSLTTAGAEEVTTTAAKSEITVIYTNDVHTYIDKTLSYATVSAMKQDYQKAGKQVLLVDAGDHIQGTAYGGMDEGKTIVQLMNAAGYDIATLGNHEFDYGMARALATVEEAKFP